MAKYDQAHKATEKYLTNLENRIAEIYKQAADEMQDTVDAYFESFNERCEKQQAKVDAGEMTKSEYIQWENTQLARGEKYSALQNSLAECYTNANEIAHAYVYDVTPSIYSLNKNYSAYTIEQSSNDPQIDFNLYDEATVRRLIIKNPNTMPYYPEYKAINRGIDLKYGKEQINASILSGILQGKSLKQLARDLMNRLTNMNLNSALRTARTAFTSAENGGRQDTYDEAVNMGIKLKKQWLATLDTRTRDAHRRADGQIVDYNDYFDVGGELLSYPGDPLGNSPWNLYNCRCTMIAVLPDVDTSDAERWSRNPETGEPELLSDMTYDEWAEEKGIENKTLADEPSTQQTIAQTAEEHIPESSKKGTKINQEGFLMFSNGSDARDYFHENASQEWWDNLSREEQDAIEKYTGAWYGSVNRALRGDNYEASKSAVQKIIKDASSALSKYELKDDIITYRGLSASDLDNAKVGDIFHDGAFSSSSTVESSAFSGRYLMEIRIPAGKGSGAWISDASDYVTEFEYLLQRGSYFHIDDIQENYGKYEKKFTVTLISNDYNGEE